MLFSTDRLAALPISPYISRLNDRYNRQLLAYILDLHKMCYCYPQSCLTLFLPQRLRKAALLPLNEQCTDIVSEFHSAHTWPRWQWLRFLKPANGKTPIWSLWALAMCILSKLCCCIHNPGGQCAGSVCMYFASVLATIRERVNMAAVFGRKQFRSDVSYVGCAQAFRTMC